MVTSVKLVLFFLLFLLSSSLLFYEHPFSLCYGEIHGSMLSHLLSPGSLFLNIYVNAFWRLIWGVFKETLFLFLCSASILW